jgi:hypothetical protein
MKKMRRRYDQDRSLAHTSGYFRPSLESGYRVLYLRFVLHHLITDCLLEQF